LIFKRVKIVFSSRDTEITVLNWVVTIIIL